MFTSLLSILLTRSLKPFIFENSYTDQLDFLDIDNPGLYVHIPFCRELCSFFQYCKETYTKKKADSYKKALLKEIELV